MKMGLLACVLVLSVGCASTPTRLEGTTGPVAWRVTDTDVVKREIDGRDSDVYVAKLALKELPLSRASGTSELWGQLRCTVPRAGTRR